MFCMKCGQNIPDGSKICPNCGADIPNTDIQNMNSPLNSAEGNYIPPSVQIPKQKKKTSGCLVAILLVLIAFLLMLIIGAVSSSKKVKSAEWEMDSILIESEQDTEVYIKVNIPSDGKDVEKSDVEFDIDDPSVCGIEFTDFNDNAVKCTIIPHSNGITGITATVQGKKTHAMNVSVSMESLEKPIDKSDSQNDSKSDSQNSEAATTTAKAEKPKKTETVTTKDNATIGQKNALASAKSYLEFTSFSYQGLIEQLEFENYTHDEAVYGAENCGADWNEQALLNAKSYLETSAFSYNGLIEQLEYEKYTNAEAVYGVDNCGADWNEQAAKCAQSYLEFSSFSRQELIDQLVYEGFTQEQAEYGVSSVGY